MKKAKTKILAFAAGEMEKEPRAVAMAILGDDMLVVVRPKRKAAILRANVLLTKLGWRPAGPWEEPS